MAKFDFTIGDYVCATGPLVQYHSLRDGSYRVVGMGNPHVMIEVNGETRIFNGIYLKKTHPPLATSSGASEYADIMEAIEIMET